MKSIKKMISLFLLMIVALSAVSCSYSEQIFINAFNRSGASNEQILSFLKDENVPQTVKYSFTCSPDLTLEQLCLIFEECDGVTAKGAMDQIKSTNREKAYELADAVLNTDYRQVESTKLISSMHAVSTYFILTPNADKIQKDQAIAKLLEIFYGSEDENVRLQAFYAVDGMCDYELFDMLMNAEGLTQNMKQNLINSNIEVMIEKLETAAPGDNINAIISALYIVPDISVCDALEEAISAGRIRNSSRIRAVIAHVRSKNS